MNSNQTYLYFSPVFIYRNIYQTGAVQLQAGLNGGL